MSSRLRPLLWFALAAYLVVNALYGLGSYPLIDPDESRYAQSAREMTARGDYLVPYLDGRPRLNKPPLFYWAEIGAAKVLGSESEFSARLPSALGGLVMVTFAGLVAARMYGRGTGVFAAGVLLSSPLFAVVTRLATTDALMSGFLTAALCCWWRLYVGKRKLAWGLAAWCMLALAVLAKGPVALVLFVLVVTVFAASAGEWSVLKKTFHPLGVGVFLALVLPWPIAVIARMPHSTELWWRETVYRYFSGVDHGGSLLFPVAIALAGTFPWWLLFEVPPAGGILDFLGRLKRERASGFLLTWAAVTVVFFTLSRSQLATYLLPALPPVAIGAAAAATGYWKGLRSRGHAIALAASGSAAGALAAICYGLAIGELTPLGAAAPAGAILAVAVLISVLAIKKRLRLASALLVFAIALSTTMVATPVLRAVSSHRSLKHLAVAWHDVFEASDQLYFVTPLRHSIVYYAERPVTELTQARDIDTVLLGKPKAAIIMVAAGLRYIEGSRQPEFFLAGREEIGSREYVLVTNFPPPAGEDRVRPPENDSHRP